MKLDVLKQNPYWNKTKNKLQRCYCSKTKAPTEKYKLSKSQKKRRDLRKLCFCEQQRKRVIRREYKTKQKQAANFLQNYISVICFRERHHRRKNIEKICLS